MHNEMLSPCGHNILFLQLNNVRHVPQTQLYIECEFCHSGQWENLVVHDADSGDETE
jgi:hypothetical protein